jgi:hypothetical protein
MKSERARRALFVCLFVGVYSHKPNININNNNDNNNVSHMFPIFKKIKKLDLVVLGVGHIKSLMHSKKQQQNEKKQGRSNLLSTWK